MNPHQNDDDMRITTSSDVLLELQDRIAALESELARPISGEASMLIAVNAEQARRIAELEGMLEFAYADAASTVAKLEEQLATYEKSGVSGDVSERYMDILSLTFWTPKP